MRRWFPQSRTYEGNSNCILKTWSPEYITGATTVLNSPVPVDRRSCLYTSQTKQSSASINNRGSVNWATLLTVTTRAGLEPPRQTRSKKCLYILGNSCCSRGNIKARFLWILTRQLTPGRMLNSSALIIVALLSVLTLCNLVIASRSNDLFPKNN